MATHSSTLAWKIPWTEESGRLPTMELQRVDTTERLHFHFHFRNKTVFWAELLHISRQAFAPDIKKNAR